MDFGLTAWGRAEKDRLPNLTVWDRSGWQPMPSSNDSATQEGASSGDDFPTSAQDNGPPSGTFPCAGESSQTKGSEGTRCKYEQKRWSNEGTIIEFLSD